MWYVCYTNDNIIINDIKRYKKSVYQQKYYRLNHIERNDIMIYDTT